MTKQSVNYVWIGKQNNAPPLNNVDMVIRNARTYPDATFNIWIDTNFLEKASLEQLSQYIRSKADINNIAIRYLNEEVIEYQNNQIFSPKTSNDIWSRVDLARLLVIDHIFESSDSIDQVFYADFDVADVRIKNRTIQKKLSDLGMVFGATYKLDIENGFMGFTRARSLDFLVDLIEASCVEAEKGRNSWKVLCDTLQLLAEEHGEEVKDFSYKLLRSIGYKLPDSSSKISGLSK